ncbi:MAG TPA: hypothetical protein VJ508_15545, partial [Saprospiraceae bacterium]|nr:hypothetical protein [Saprospiraceae bacterium]
ENGCEDVYSNAVTVTVTPDITISAQPVGGSICTGGTFNLSVTASGSPNILYQWQQYDGTNWNDIPGATLPSYSTGVLTTTTMYRVFVYATENGCEDVYSSVATVNVTPDISISAQPVGGSICTGGTFNLNVTASGSPNILYQWEQFDGTNWNAIPGATFPTYNTGALTATTVYRVFVYATENGCEDVYSSEATVEVTPDISISAQPIGGSICTGGNFNLNVIANGSPNILYQWQQFNGTVWNDIPGATLPMYNTGILTSTTQYRVFVYANESGCEDVYSAPATVIVTPDISISAQPVGGAICTGGNFTLTVTASGSPNILYQWEVFDGTNWNAIPGATLPTYNTGVLTATTQYRVFVYANESGCEDVYSAPATVEVTPDISISAQPVGGAICTGGNFTLTVTASGSPNILYQWEIFDGTNWNAIPGATFPAYNSGVLTATTQYRVFVYANESGCEDVYSAPATVEVTPDISISAQPMGGSICIGGNFTLTVTASGSPNILYQWEQFDGTNWNAIPGATLPTYNTGVLTATTQYRVFVYANESGCEDVYSASATVIVTPDISISAQPVGGAICTGGNFTLTVTASGSPNILYQWEIFDGTNWNAIPGATLPTYNTGVLTATTQYRVFVYANESGCEDVYSSIAIVNVSPDLVVTTQPTDVNECVGGTNTMTVTVSGGSGAITYQWQQSANVGGPFANSTGTGANTATYTPDSSTPGTTYYRVLVNAANNGCDQATSNTAVAIISPDLVVTTQPTDVNECVGGTNTMTVTVSGGSGAITYQWQQSANVGGPFANSTGTGANTATYTPDSSVPGTTYYRVLVNAANNGCDQATSNTAVAVISPDLQVTTQPTDVNECVGGTNTMTVTVSGGSGAITYQWQQSANVGGPWANSTGTGANTATYTPDSSVPGTTYYRVLVNAANNGCDQATSNTAVAVISADLVVTTQPTDVNECVGGTNTMTVTVSSGSGSITYQWQ